MSFTRNYVIAGGRGDDPANISMKMEPIKLQNKMELAVKSVAYGEIFNVTEVNNTFKIKISLGVLDIVTTLLPDQTTSLSIPCGRYNHPTHVLEAICRSLNAHLMTIIVTLIAATAHLQEDRNFHCSFNVN